MKTYVKLINDSTVEFAPRVKGSIINYHLCYSKLQEEGYLELQVKEKPSETKPLVKFRIEGNRVIQYAISSPPTSSKTKEELQLIKRLERNQRLNGYDWSQLPDSPLTEEQKQVYREYRQFLRDWTEQEEWWNKQIPSFDEWKMDKEQSNG